MKPHIPLAVLCGCAAWFAQNEVSFAYRGEIERPEGTEARSAEIGDIDHDGCCDMVIGATAGNILVYEAVEPDSLSFASQVDLLLDGSFAKFHFASRSFSLSQFPSETACRFCAVAHIEGVRG